MKFFAVLSAVIAVALSSPVSWTIPEVTEALQNPSTDPHLIPYLEEALNELMLQAFSGHPAPTTTVSSVVQDFSAWTLHELSEALQNPDTDPALIPYLEHGLNTMMANIMAGEQQDYVIVGTPVGLLPIEVVVPVVPAPVEAPVVVPPSAPSSSPLVQIIVNVKSQQAPVAPAPVVIPEPIDVIPVIPSPVVLPPAPSPVVIPSPVVLPAPPSPVVIPSPVVLPAPPSPVVIPSPVDIPSPVIVPNPVDIIAVNPDVAFNPVDIISIAAPEVNPVDILSPIPVVSPVGAVGEVVGPIV